MIKKELKHKLVSRITNTSTSFYRNSHESNRYLLLEFYNSV